MEDAELRVRFSKALVLNLRSKDVLANGFRCYVGGESGSGKTSVAASIAEQVIEKDEQVVVLDSHGEYGELWGVAPARVMRVGYGGAPVAQDSVEQCLDVVRAGKSLLLDLSHWTDLYPKELDTFVLAFARALYGLRRQRPKFTMLLVEEAANYMPQMQSAGQMDNVKVFIGMITGGRKYGLQFLLTTQRQSMVDLNVIAGCNVRVFLRTTEFADWKRVKKYIPDSLGVTFDGEGTGIRWFRNGEAVVTSRWVPVAKVRLVAPQVEMWKAEL